MLIYEIIHLTLGVSGVVLVRDNSLEDEKSVFAGGGGGEKNATCIDMRSVILLTGKLAWLQS